MKGTWRKTQLQHSKFTLQAWLQASVEMHVVIAAALIKEALALVGPDLLKVNPPPHKGSWRRSGAAPATTKAPYKHRAAKHEAA